MSDPNESNLTHSDHEAHTAPPEPRSIKKNLWQRWMAWSGSFLVLSILAHVFLLGGATVLVVQVVQGRKEKLKFTAPPPNSAGATEHKVKPSKKTAASVPAVSRRITSSAANASIALPAMDMNSSSGPDVMASVMNGLGSSGLGSGAAGMAAMPLAGLTAFGFKGSGGGGLKGYFYDLKQTSDRKPTAVKSGGAGTVQHYSILEQFFKNGWDENILDKFYKSKDQMITHQIYIPYMDARIAPQSFGVEKEVTPSHWVILYKGTVTAPKDGSFRFIGFADDVLAVRFDGQNVFLGGLNLGTIQGYFNSSLNPFNVGRGNVWSRWFSVQSGKTYPIEVLISEVPGGSFSAWLQIEDRSPSNPYPKRTFPGAESLIAYPLFQTFKGDKIPERGAELTPPKDLKPGKKWKPFETAPELAPDPVIFQGK